MTNLIAKLIADKAIDRKALVNLYKIASKQDDSKTMLIIVKRLKAYDNRHNINGIK